MTTEIKVFGDTAKQIKEGQVFTAKIGDVEGRTVVTLVAQEDPLEGRTENDLIRKELLID